MAGDDKATVERNAASITRWLAEHRADFEQHGVEEDSLSGALGIGMEEVMAAVDHLENHEIVVRWPQALTTPPRFLLKPGRSWPETRDKLMSASSGNAAA